MEAPLQGHDVLASEASEDEPALMALHRADGEVGYVLIGEGVDDFYLLCQPAEARAQDDGGEGTHGCVLPEPFSSLLDVL